jgi:hypothetical protein
MKVRKKPIEVEAVQVVEVTEEQVTYEEGDHDAPWMLEALENGEAWPMVDASLCIRTLEGDMKAKAGDYVVRGVEGELYPVRADIFAKTYEQVT